MRRFFAASRLSPWNPPFGCRGSLSHVAGCDRQGAWLTRGHDVEGEAQPQPCGSSGFTPPPLSPNCYRFSASRTKCCLISCSDFCPFVIVAVFRKPKYFHLKYHCCVVQSQLFSLSAFPSTLLASFRMNASILARLSGLRCRQATVCSKPG